MILAEIDVYSSHLFNIGCFVANKEDKYVANTRIKSPIFKVFSSKSFCALITSALISMNVLATQASAEPVHLAAAAPAAAPSPVGQIGDKWAIVVGISRFADGRVPGLKYSSKDAQDFANYLTDDKGGGFRKDHVKVLLDEEASKINIMDMLGDSFLPHAAGPNDLVVVYLSTHGSPAGADIRGVNYVVAYDTRVDKLFATGIEMRQLVRVIKERVHTGRVVLVLDTCYSGAGADDDAHKGLKRTNIDANMLAGGDSVVISSSAPDQRSWESDGLHNSYFTRFLIDAFRQTPSVDQAFHSMRERVQGAVLKDKGALQTPVMAGSNSVAHVAVNSAPTVIREVPATIPLSGEIVAQGNDHKSLNDFSEYGVHLRAAVQLMSENKMWDAAHEIEDAIRQNPTSVEASLIQSDIYDAQGRYRESLEAAKRAVVNGKNSSQAHSNLARAYMRSDVADEALRQAQAAVTMDPSNSMAHYQLGAINQRLLNKIDVAEQEFKKALELNSLNVRAMVAMAVLSQDQGRPVEEAIQYLQKALGAQSDDWQAHLELGRVLFNAKNNAKEAEGELRKAAELYPDGALIHCELGHVLLSEGKQHYEEAELEFKKAMKLGANLGLPHLRYAEFLEDKRNRMDEAESEYRQAIQLDQTLDEAYVRLGDLLIKTRHAYDDADPLYKKALENNPKNAGAYIGLATISGDLLKDYLSAQQNFSKAITLLDNKSSHAHDLLGQLFENKLNRLAEARKEYESAIALEPNNAMAQYHLGMLLLATGKPKVAPDDALVHFKKAAELAPEVSLFKTKLGWVLLTRYKDPQTARELFTKAIEANIADSEAHYRLGMLLIDKGERKAGENELKTAHQQDPRDSEIDAAFSRFANH
jgi:tetratricopeptide (TPR) repeat protein